MLRYWFPIGSLRRIVAGNTISQMVGRIASSVATVVVSFLIASRFGADGYGDFIKVSTYVGFFYLFADFGMNAVYVRRAASLRGISEQTIRSQWQTLFGTRLVMSVILVAVSILVLSVFPKGISQGYTPLVRFGIILLVPAIIAQAITTSTNAYFQNKLRYEWAAWAQYVGSFLMVIVALALSSFVTLGGPLLGVLSFFVGSVGTSVVALMFVWRSLGTVRPLFRMRETLDLLRESAPLGFVLICNLVYFHVDSVVLTLSRSTSEVGIYGLAYKIFELPLVIPIFFMNAVYPLLFASVTSKRDRNRIFTYSLRILLVSSVVISSLIWIFAPWLSMIRQDFLWSVAPLRVLVLGLPIYFVSALFMWFIIAEKRQWMLLYIHGAAMVGNIVCNIIFVPRFGYMAAAWITIVSELCILVASGLVIFFEFGRAKGVAS